MGGAVKELTRYKVKLEASVGAPHASVHVTLLRCCSSRFDKLTLRILELELGIVIGFKNI
jgi:hypothetical protein